jgi:hypothetical protein
MKRYHALATYNPEEPMVHTFYSVTDRNEWIEKDTVHRRPLTPAERIRHNGNVRRTLILSIN